MSSEFPSRRPADDVARIETIDGVPLQVRPIRDEDGEALAAAVERLTPESRYERFLAPVAALSDSQARYFTHIDHRDHEALIALSGKEIVGIARYIRVSDRPTAAEVAVTVADAWQSRGVGTALLSMLTERARAAGIVRFVAVCLASNSAMIDLLRELAPRHTFVGPPRSGVVEVTVELDADDTTAISRVLGSVARSAPTP